MDWTRKPAGVAYLVTNVVNGKQYVGITSKSLAQRWRCHKAVVGTSSASLLHRAMLKHGVENFQTKVVASASSWADLCAVERILIGQFQSFARDGHGYNLTLGGEGVLGLSHSEATKEKQRQASTGKKPSQATLAKLRSHPPSADHFALIRAAAAAPEARMKKSITLTGRSLSEPHKAKLRGLERTAEHSEAIRQGKLGNKASDPTRARMRASHAERLATADRATFPGVRAVTTPKGTYPSAAVAAEAYGIARHTAWARAARGTPGWGFAA